VRGVPDHVAKVAGLAARAVDVERDRAALPMAAARRRHDGADRRRLRERLRDVPRAARLLRDVLQSRRVMSMPTA
jgi:hypothetical protein